MGNLSGVDRIIHIILGVLIAIAALMIGEGLSSTIVLIVGILVVLFGIFGWSGVYSIFGISTRKSAHSKISGNDIKKAVKGHLEAKAAVSSLASKPSKTTKKTTTKKAATSKTTTSKKASTKKAPAKKTAAKKITKKSK